MATNLDIILLHKLGNGFLNQKVATSSQIFNFLRYLAGLRDKNETSFLSFESYELTCTNCLS